MPDPETTTLQPPPEDAQATGAAQAEPPTASKLVRILDQYLADIQAGRGVSRAELLAAHPDLAEQLEPCLAGIDFIQQAAQAGNETPSQLGDFRILREIGRGGMGVVFEAEQISLKRRVALKVLRLGAVADREAMQRFQREAETVARLHHTNIVPVFAVGSEQGVHYYAMQYIEGRSLAAVLHTVEADLKSAVVGADLKSAPTEIDAREVARWALQAAEALAHAHQRGVIHRDIKPSNLLLDGEGVVWLTDFGLARRAEDVTLTVTGALMGTPRYMSPEQANAVRQPVDHRTDIYSLGATLYELATSKPVFDADTPQGVITQILHTEPVAPRRLRQGLPRDLETIILKCLHKEPGRRYASAGELADDLRAFLESRPIRGRRPNVMQRLKRWAGKQRRSLMLAGATAVVASLLALAAVYAVHEHERWQLGYLLLTTNGPHLKAEVLNERDALVTPTFTVPTQDWLSLPTGDYRLRISRQGTLSETLQLPIYRGVQKQFQLDLPGQRYLFPEAEFNQNEDTQAIVNLSGVPQVVLIERNKGMQLRGSWEIAWASNPQREPVGAKHLGHTRESVRMLESRPQLGQPPADLNHDGVRDLIWAGQDRMIAVSGQNGQVLWQHIWLSTPPKEFAGKKVRARHGNGGWQNEAVGRPILTDVDGDGVADAVVFVASHGEEMIVEGTKPEQIIRSAPQRWIEAVSGATGETLWRFPLATTGLVPPLGDVSRLLELVHMKGGDMALCLDGQRIVALEPKSGKTAWNPVDLGGQPSAVPQVLDLDGDGRPDAVLALTGTRMSAVDVQRGDLCWASRDLGFVPLRAPQLIAGERPALLLLRNVDAEHLELAALSWQDGKSLWQRTTRAIWPPATRHEWEPEKPAPPWPLLADLDGDGRPEIILPSRPERTNALPPADPNTIHIDLTEKTTNWAGLAVLDSATGDVRWTRHLPAVFADQLFVQIDQFTAGPDLNGDGQREIFLASFADPYRADPGEGSSTHQSLYATALSGKTGETLWWWRDRIRADQGGRLEALSWWQKGPDGLPFLLVPYNTDLTSNSLKTPSTTYVLTSSTGRLTHLLGGIGDPRVADLDGDGIPDLYAIVHPPWGDKKSHVYGIRGLPPEAWRRAGGWGRGPDLDGDGIPDLTGAAPDGKGTAAISGRDGRDLWQSEVAGPFLTQDLPDGDLDGDGIADFISNTPLKRRAISGKTGKPLWPMPKLTDPDQDLKGDAIGISHATPAMPAPRAFKLTTDSPPVIVYAYSLQFGSTNVADMDKREHQSWLAAVSGTTGAVLWKTPLSERKKGSFARLQLVGAADLDGDGVKDLVLLQAGPDYWELKALRGTDGELLWRRQLEQPSKIERIPFWDVAPTAWVRSEAKPEEPSIIVLQRACPLLPRSEKMDPQHFPVGPSYYQVLALDGKSGKPAWSWRGVDYAATTIRLNHTPGLPWNARATLAKLPSVGPAICLYLLQTKPGVSDFNPEAHFVVLDMHGKERRKTVLPVEVSWSSGINMENIRVADLDGDGDGFDELLWIAAPTGQPQTLFATRDGFDLRNLLWKTTDSLADIIPGKSAQPGIAVFNDRGRLRGDDGKTRRTLWFSPGGALTSLADGELRTYAQVADSTCCYILSGTETARFPEPADARPPMKTAADPRLAMLLPWVSLERNLLLVRFAGEAFVLAVLPVFWLGRALRRRSWRLGAGLVVYLAAVTGAAVAGWLLPEKLSSFGGLFAALDIMSWTAPVFAPLGWLGVHPDIRWLRVPLGLPAALAVGVLALALLSRRWRRLGLLALALAGMCVVAGVIAFQADKDRFEAAQYYSWYAWPWIFLYGAYLLGLALIAGWVLIGAYRLGRAPFTLRARNVPRGREA